MTERPTTDTTVTRRSMLEKATDTLRDADVESFQQEARWIVQEALGCSGASLAAHPHASPSASAQAAVQRMLTRRTDGEPLQYVVGHAVFRGLRLRVTPDVLIPRPETEGVVEVTLTALESTGFARPRVLDVGTGSGCIALALKDEYPEAEVYACDVSTAALGMARENTERLGLDVEFIEADALQDDFVERVPADLEVIVSNPPYVVDVEAELLPSSVQDYEPAEALFAGEDPLCFYRAIIRHALRLLRNGGALVFETHVAYGAEVVRLCRASGLMEVQLHQDLTGRDRIVTARYMPEGDNL